MTSSNSSPVVPSEVGWQFVPQYYTFVNKQPHRLHCFYTKASTFIHGTEGEDGKPCHGQQEIHDKITSIGFQDCKVFIHSVDAQSSANGGIIIQVIGEMSNHNEPWRKFVQTFFLAEQPNGYFVLNDIFRFLKEETAEYDDAADADETTHVSQEPVNVGAPVPASPAPQVYDPVVPVTREPEPTPPPSAPSPAPVVIPLSPPPVEEAPTTDIPETPTIVQTPSPAPDPLPPSTTTQPAQPNGIHPVSEPEKPAAPVPVAEKSPTTPAPPSPVPIPAAVAPPPAAPPAQSTPPASMAASASAPTAPRSWASLAASNPRKWGSAVAQESRGTTEIPVNANPGANANVNNGGTPGTQTPPRASSHHHPHQHQHQHQGQGPHPNYVAAQNLTVSQCFVKGVTEPISQTLLTNYLTQRFGPVKDLEIVRTKACAFFEFLSVDAARRAIIASLPQPHGGEGGLWIEVGGEVGQVRISVETKKERGDRPVSRPRGGAPVGAGVNGDAVGAGSGSGSGSGRGGFRGRGGMRGRGGGGSAGK